MTVSQLIPGIGEKENEHNAYKFQQLETYTMRDPGFADSARVHPQAAEVTRLTHQWLRDHDIHTQFDAKSFQKFLDMDCSRSLVMVYPDSPLAGTVWIAEFVTLLFVVDDILDSRSKEMALGTSSHLMIEWYLVIIWSFPKDCDDMISGLLSQFDDQPEYRSQIEDLCNKCVAEGVKHPFGTPYPEKISPCSRAFQDLWLRSVKVMSKNWGLRQAAAMHNYLGAHIQERLDCKEDKILTVDEYAAHRTKVGGIDLLVGASADFIHMNTDIAPDEVFYSKQVKHLLDAVCLGCSLINDIYSFPKELRNGEYFNMVILVSYWQKCSYNEAAEIVVKMTEDINRDIIATREEITKTFAPEFRKALEPTLHATTNVMAGNQQFYKSSGRYDAQNGFKKESDYIILHAN